MFARRPAVATPAPAETSHGVPDVLASPYAGAGAALLMAVAACAALIVLTGDPRAGAPSVRVSLDAGKPDPKLAMRPGGALTPALGIDAAVSLESLQPGQEVALPDTPIQGEAVITLPQGASVAGGAALPLALTKGAPRPAGPPLPTAPIAGVSAPGPAGLLPVAARDGRTPFSVYSRPFRDNGRPKVALVIGGLGLNAALTKAAIDRLPADVTLSFVPYADNLQGWINLARASGHEVLLEIPMEPLDYPNNDPGPYTLMASAPGPEVVKRLEWLMSRASGYFGVSNYLGGRFLNSDSGMAVFTSALKNRGLAFVDDGSANRKGGAYARASADAVVDEQLSAESVQRQLLQLEAKALQKGSALGSGFSYPVTVEQVLRWSQGLANRGYQLAPASAIARR